MPAVPESQIIDTEAPADVTSSRARRPFVFYQQTTFLSLVIGYMGYYLCRQNFSAAYAPMQLGLGIDTMTFGAIASAGTIVYAIGKVVTGPFADSYGGRRVFLLGLFGSAVATALFGLGSGVGFFLFAWTLSRFFQSMGWAGMVNVLSHWFAAESYGTAMGAASISYQLGGVVATFFAGGLLGIGLGWRALFFVPALALTLVGLVIWRTLIDHPEEVGYSAPGTVSAITTTHDVDAPSLSSRFRLVLSKPLFWVVCVLSFILTMIRECFITWAPAYFSVSGSGPAMAAFKSAVFPLLGCGGTLFAGWLSDRYLQGRRGPIMAVFLLGSSLSLLALAYVQELGARFGFDPSLGSVVLIGLTGFFIFGPYSMVGGGVLALDFGGRAAGATAAGLLDGVGYVGASIAGIGVASIVAKYHWSTAFLILAAASLVSLIFCLLLWRHSAVHDS